MLRNLASQHWDLISQFYEKVYVVFSYSVLLKLVILGKLCIDLVVL